MKKNIEKYLVSVATDNAKRELVYLLIDGAIKGLNELKLEIKKEVIMLTQTAINNATERCYIITRMYPNVVDPETYFQILFFLNKLRTNNKMNKIMAPLSIEPDTEYRGIRFEWIRVLEDKKIDTLDIVFFQNQSFN